MRLWLVYALMTIFSGLSIMGTMGVEAEPRKGSTRVKEVFTLRQTLREALRRHPRLQAASWQVEAARYSWLSARSFLNPFLEITPFLSGEIGMDAEIRLFQVIEVSGRRKYRSQIANSLLDAARQDRKETVLDIALAAEEAYYDLLAAQRIVAVVKENVALAERLVRLTRKQFKAGDVPYLDVMRAEVALARARQELLRAEANLTVAQAAFNRALGRSPTRPVAASGSLETLPPWRPPKDPYRYALAHRPLIHAAQARLRAARAKVSMEKTAWRPDLVVQLFRNEDRVNFFGLGFALPLWDWGRIRHSVRQAQSQVRAAEKLLMDAQQAVITEVHQALANAKAADRLIVKFRREVLEKLESLLEKTVTGYRGGLLTSLDVLDAQRSVTQARIEYVRLQAERAKAFARLRRALGILEVPLKPTLKVARKEGA